MEIVVTLIDESTGMVEVTFYSDSSSASFTLTRREWSKLEAVLQDIKTDLEARD